MMTKITFPARALLFLPMGAAAASLSAQDTAVAALPELDPYVVGEALPPAEAGRPLVQLTLDEAVSRALERNLDIQTARLDPDIQGYALRSARAAFSPTLSANVAYNSSTNQSTSQLDGAQETTNKRVTVNTSLAQTLPWYGGRLSADFQNSRNETNNSFATLNPSYRSSLSLSYTQPLLEGLRIDNQRASVINQEIQGRITDLQIEAQVENIVAQVRERYWALRSAVEQIEIQRRALAQAEQLVEENRIRQQAGQSTRYQVIQAEAQLASAQQALLNAEVQWRNQELAFKQLLVDGPEDPLLTRTVNPVDQLLLVQGEVDIDGAVETALRERTDIRQQRDRLRISEVDLEVSETSALPTLDLVTSYSLSGVGGDLFDRSGLGGEPVLVEEGGYLDGLGDIADFQTPTWNVSLQASYPLGTNGAEAELERAELQHRQQELALRSQELAVVTQVTQAGLAVRNTFLQHQAAQRSREASEQNLQAELLRFDVGVATNFEVVTAQNQLTSARLSELQALIAHLNAIAEFERVQRVGG